MIPREHVEKILALAVQAPSGDNSQPWRFEVHGREVDLYNIPGKDYSPYNFRERGSLFANGALIENIVIAATSLGYEIDIDLFPTPANSKHIACLNFSEKNMAVDPLLGSIEVRTTNRKPYQKTPLIPGHKDQLLAMVQDIGFGKLLLLEEHEKIARFAKTVSLSDQLIFEEKSIHDAIFGSIRWTKEEEEVRRGMYIKTLELPPPARVMFKALKNWPTLTFLNHVGISRFIAAQSAVVYESCSAIGMLVIPNDTNESYVKAGRVFERLWLAATKVGMSFQPVTALAYLAARAVAGDAGELSPSHVQQVIEAQKRINELFNNPQGTVAMMFRMGYSAIPSARSRKAKPDITFLS